MLFGHVENWLKPAQTESWLIYIATPANQHALTGNTVTNTMVTSYLNESKKLDLIWMSKAATEQTASATVALHVFCCWTLSTEYSYSCCLTQISMLCRWPRWQRSTVWRLSTSLSRAVKTKRKEFWESTVGLFHLIFFHPNPLCSEIRINKNVYYKRQQMSLWMS